MARQGRRRTDPVVTWRQQTAAILLPLMLLSSLMSVGLMPVSRSDGQGGTVLTLGICTPYGIVEQTIVLDGNGTTEPGVDPSGSTPPGAKTSLCAFANLVDHLLIGDGLRVDQPTAHAAAIAVQPGQTRTGLTALAYRARAPPVSMTL